MRVRLRKAWESRAPRERTIIAILIAVLATGLYLWLVTSGYQAQTKLRASVTTLRAQAARLDQQAAEFERLRATPVTAVPVADLRGLVEAQAAAAGLSSALVKIDSPDASQVVVVFGGVAFTDWLAWVSSLKSRHIHLDACRIEALPAPGRVNVTATLLQAKQQ